MLSTKVAAGLKALGVTYLDCLAKSYEMEMKNDQRLGEEFCDMMR